MNASGKIVTRPDCVAVTTMLPESDAAEVTGDLTCALLTSNESTAAATPLMVTVGTSRRSRSSCQPLTFTEQQVVCTAAEGNTENSIPPG